MEDNRYPFPLRQISVFDDQAVFPGALLKITAYKRIECSCCPKSQPEVKYSLGPSELSVYGERTFAFVRDVKLKELHFWVVDAGGQMHEVYIDLEDVLDEYIKISAPLSLFE